MAYLMKTSTRFLGEQEDFDRESYLEGFIVGNPNILCSSKDKPEHLASVFIIGRQEICKIYHEQKTGITDLICLIWDADSEKYQIWVYELKVRSNNPNDVRQLLDYLQAIESPGNKDHRDYIVDRAKSMLIRDDLLDPNPKVRGALCAQDFSDEVMDKIIEANKNRAQEEKLLAIKIYRFPQGDDVFVLVEPFIGEEAPSGKRVTYYDDIPKLSKQELMEGLTNILSKRKNTHPQRFQQLKVLLEMLSENPEREVTQEELRNAWGLHGLPKEDQGLSVSQLLGYKNSGPFRQIITWKRVSADIKDNYKLRDTSYSEVLREIFKKV